MRGEGSLKWAGWSCPELYLLSPLFSDHYLHNLVCPGLDSRLSIVLFWGQEFRFSLSSRVMSAFPFLLDYLYPMN